MDPEKGRIRIAAAVLALIVVVAVVAVVAMPRDVSVEKEGDGNLSFEGDKSLRAFGSLEIEIEPGEGCFAKVYLDGDEVASDVASYTYDAPFADFSKHVIKVVFEHRTPVPVPDEKVTLTVEKSDGGTVDPEGSETVVKGTEESISITPDPGYVIDEVRIDGNAVPVCNAIDVRMDADHTVSVSFRPVDSKDVAVTIDVDANIEIRTIGGDVDFGTIVPSGEVKVKPGSSLKITVLLNPGFEIEDFIVNGKSVGKVTEYTIEDIRSPISVSISVVKKVDGYTISASAGAGGRISPSGDVKVEKGKDATFTFTPNSGYSIDSIIVDGKKIDNTNSYTFASVSSNHTISVSFKYNGGGSVTPTKTLTKIEVTEQPAKTQYIAGEAFDASGMEVTAVYSDGSRKVVTDYTYSPTGALTSADKNITISYGGRTCTQAVSVYDLDSITVDASGCRMSYLVGESFDDTGLIVTGHYGPLNRVETGYSWSPNGELKEDNTTVTVTFGGKTAQITIAVVEPTEITGIEITDGPTKDHYFDDQVFVKDGMIVSGVYSDDVKVPLDLKDVTISESDGTVTATYVYGSKTYTATCKVTRDLNIKDVSELKYFRDKVNDGKSNYKDRTVALNADLDLNDEPWTPIGPNSDDNDKKFKGTFDGQSRKISNLYINTSVNKKYQATGFFGALNGTVKNLKFENAEIVGFSGGNSEGNTDNGIAVVAGSIYNSGSITNVEVKDASIEGNRYIGAISGYVYGSITNCSVKNVTVVATPNSDGAKYDNGDKVGGIAGYIGEGNHSLKNCYVSGISISGYRNLGGIVGTSYAIPDSCSVTDATIIHARDVISEEPADGNQSGIIAGTRISLDVPASNTVHGTVVTDDVGVLSSTCANAGTETVTIELMDGTYIPNIISTSSYKGEVVAITEEKDIMLKPAKDQNKVIFDGQFYISGRLSVTGIQMNSAHEIQDEISQFKYSGVAVITEGQFIAENVTFVETLSSSTAITAYWSKDDGTSISVINCIFNCNGNRPIRSDCNVSVENCIFNDQYRYTVQMTSKADTVTGIPGALVLFKNNTINAGNTAESKPVYGVQLEGSEYGCRNLIIKGSGNTINYGDTGKTGAMYYCDCGKVDHGTITWNTESHPIHKSYTYIMTADDLKQLAIDVNQGKNYRGITLALGADIDLNNEEWTPIGKIIYGSDGKNQNIGFEGIFDGQGYTISNLKLDDQDRDNVGLFGLTLNGEVKNLTIENASVRGYLDVGVVAGTPYSSKYTNITVKGHIEVNGYAYVGGVGGKNAYADWTDITIDADETSYVKADSEGYRTYVGGIIGFMGEGNQTMSNMTSNIDVIGSTCDVGGITGIAHYGNTFINCSSSGNVTLVNATDSGDQLEIGGIAGVWLNQEDTTVTITNCSFTGTLSSKLNGVPVEDGYYPYAGLIGNKYNPKSNDGRLIIGIEGFTDAIYVGTTDELLEIGNELSTIQSSYKDKTIVLMNNLDMTGKEWPVIKLNNDVGSLRFIGYGDGIIISNLMLGTVLEGNRNSSIGFIASSGSMKSLSFENISLEGLNTGDVADSGANAVGAFVGYAGTSDAITISGCNVLKSKISGGHWAGGFVGYAAGYSTQNNGPVFEVLTIEDCMIEGSTVSSPGSAGGIIGHATGDVWTRDEIKNCTVKNCTITSTGTSTNKAGSLMGTVGAGQSKYGKDGGVFVESCNVEGCTVESNESAIDRIYGRQGTIGGVLCVDGSYVFFDDTDLKAAIDSGKGKILIPSGEFELPTNLNNKTITIIGQSTDTAVVNVPQQVLGTESVTFENVTLKIENGNYQGFNSSKSAVFKNCVLEGQFFLYGPSVKFYNCTFKQSDSESYNVWTYGALDVLFSKCTFGCAGKSVLIYNEGGESNNMTITFKECTMNASSQVAGKAAVEVDASLFKHSCTVNIDKSTANDISGFGEGSISGSSVWNNKKDPAIEGVTLTIYVGGEIVLSKTKTA